MSNMKYKEGDVLNGVEIVETWQYKYPSGSSNTVGLLVCPYCGTWFERQLSSIRSSKNPSCGCYGKHGLSDHKVHKVWFSLKQRCFNKNSPKYKDYGGRGITVQEDWVKDFKAFFNYVTSLPSYPGEEGLGVKGLTLDRVNNNRNYEEGNLRWATAEEQQNNRRNNL